MDLWVVAAAAGAGYIAKNLQNFSEDKKAADTSANCLIKVHTESRNFLQQLRDKTCPLRKLARKGVQNDAFLEEENHLEEDYNIGWISSLPTVLKTDESLECGDGQIRNGRFSRRRERRRRLIEPLDSLGSCLDAQLCKEHEKMSNLVPFSRVRPLLLVTEGSQMLSRSSSDDASFTQFERCREKGIRENGSILRSASLEQIELVQQIQRKPRKSFGSSKLNVKSDLTQGSNSMLPFIIGMTIGILSSTTATKGEVDKLDKELKQTRNLVQDLYDELDMKEMITVKDLTNESRVPEGEYDTPPSIKEPIASPSVLKTNNFTKFDDKMSENPEVMSKIEAELQAELDTLEQNLKTSAFERIFNLVELDQDFEPDIVRGDLSNGIQIDTSESGNKTTDTTTHFFQPANYAVCPYELSIRLHELIELRLKERIEELETALSNNLDSQSITFANRSTYSKTESSSTPQSPTCLDKHYTRNNKSSTNEKSVQRVDKDLKNEDEESSSMDFYLGKQSIDGVLHEYDSISNQSFIMEEDRSVDHLVEEFSEMWDDKKSSEDDGSDDESEMLLIKQIIERRKLGSGLALKF